MQITCFVAAMSIDEQRKMKPSKNGTSPNASSSNEGGMHLYNK